VHQEEMFRTTFINSTGNVLRVSPRATTSPWEAATHTLAGGRRPCWQRAATAAAAGSQQVEALHPTDKCGMHAYTHYPPQL
jgi:hypothetical protein